MRDVSVVLSILMGLIILKRPGAEFRDKKYEDPNHSIFLESNILT